MQVAKVILDIQSNQFSNPLEFAILPGKSSQVEFESSKNYEAEVGCVCVVPFGKQFKLGFIVDIVSETEISRPTNSLKSIACVVSESFFDKDSYEFAKFIANKYLCAMATALRLFVPSGSMPRLKHVGNK
ncbi:MAG: hypothetical protein Q4F54_01680 [Coriobacteriia bacterium]|nr:hypothetical protein [Coriobacteriia bacterium]